MDESRAHNLGSRQLAADLATWNPPSHRGGCSWFQELNMNVHPTIEFSWLDLTKRNVQQGLISIFTN